MRQSRNRAGEGRKERVEQAKSTLPDEKTPVRRLCPLLRSPFYFLLSDLATSRGSIEAMPFAFEKLIVYQKAVTFADAACSLTKEFPRG